MFTIKKIAAGVAAFLLLVPPPASAVEEDQAVRRIHPLPIVYVTNLQATAQGHTINGSFSVATDEEGSVGNITYELQIIQALPQGTVGTLYVDDPVVYDRFTPNQNPLALSASEKETISFTYTPAPVPNGSYRLRVRLWTTNDRKLGWGDTPIALVSSSKDSYVIVEAESIDVASTDPITGEKQSSWAPRSGPNVAAGAAITLQTFITNPGSEAVSGFLTINTKKSLYTNQEPVSERGQEVTVAPGETKKISLPVTARQTPGAYQVLVYVQDSEDKRISGIAEYRYVVEGQSATVVSAILRDISSDKGGNAVVDFTAVGSADRTQTVKGIFEATLTDIRGSAGTVSNTFEITKAIPLQGTATIPVNRALCGTPSVTLTLRSDTGTTLDTFTTSFSDRTFSCGISRNGIIASSIALLIALGILVRMALKKRMGHALPPIAAVFLAISGLLTLHAVLPVAQANGVQYLVSLYGDANDPNENNQPVLTVASPVHQSMAHSSVYYSAEYTWLNCGNDPANGSLEVLAPTVPKAYTTANNANWASISSNQVHLPKTCNGCDSRNRTSVALSGYLTPPGIAPGATTTLWTKGKNWGWLGAEIHDYTVINIGGPNLISENLTAPATIVAGQQVRFTANAKNNGTVAASTTASSTPATRSFTTDISMVEFVRSKGYTIGINPAFDPALRGDAATELKVCQMAGYTTVTFKTDTNRFTSPADNEIAYWNGSTFITNNATSVQGVYNPAKLDNLNCGDPVSPAAPQNTGNADAGPSKSAFCVDNTNNNCKSSFDGRIPGPGNDVASLAAGQSSAIFTSDPWTATAGSHTVKVCADVNDNVPESNETEDDNCMSKDFTVTVAPTVPPTSLPPTPVPNHPPIAVAQVSINGGNAASSVTVTRGQSVQVRLLGNGSSDPDGWTTAGTGVSQGGRCEWNADLNQGVTTYERVINNPAVPAVCDTDLGTLTFWDNPGTYTYNVLRLTDAGGLQSSAGVVSVTVTALYQCNNGIDDSDPEDTLIDAQDPGCHTNNDINQQYNPTDDDETNGQLVTPTPTILISPSPTSSGGPGGFEETR